jgi:predicted DNA repair protein MutK
MAGASLLTLLDDIASVLDDVALMTKAASKKTAGVLGDDIALNAQQVSGVASKRELPVVWAVAKGSFWNKLILVPLALAISAFLPVAITPLLMLGGLYLCYEGVEKIIHSLFHANEKAHLDASNVATDPSTPTAIPEQAKIKGAIRTDFILSAEIIAITLGTVATAAFMTQATVVATVAIIMTVGVYGFVACVVKLDDLGLYLSLRQQGALAATWRAIGRGILIMAPYLMKGLSIAGTVAMFLVGGGILAHGLPGFETWLHHLLPGVSSSSGVGPALLAAIGPMLANFMLGVVAGAIAAGLMWIVKRLR